MQHLARRFAEGPAANALTGSDADQPQDKGCQTTPPSEPSKDFALEVSTSSCDRHVQATEADIYPARTASPRPLHEFPHGSIKQKTFAVENFSMFGMANTEE